MRIVRRVLLLTLVAALLPAGASAQGTGPADFSVIAKITKSKEKNDNTLIVVERLKRQGSNVGKARLKLVFHRKSIDLSGKWRFGDGTVKAKGRLSKKNPNTIRILRGTGAYAEAKGTISSKRITRERSRESFDFK